MKKHIALSLLLVGLVACGNLTKENYDKLEVGMDYNNVVEILGKPDTCKDAMIGKNCVWGDDSKNIKITFVNDKTTVYSGNGLK